MVARLCDLGADIEWAFFSSRRVYSVHIALGLREKTRAGAGAQHLLKQLASDDVDLIEVPALLISNRTADTSLPVL